MANASYLSQYFFEMYIGQEYAFTIYSYDSTHLHKVTLKLGSYTMVFNKVKGGVEQKFTIPANWANATPNAMSMNGTITCETYQSNYSTKVGSNDVETVKFKVPSTMLPSIDVTLSEAVSGIAEQFGAYVQGKSKIAVQIKGTGINGSTIRSYSSSINDVTYVNAEYTTGVIKTTSSNSYENKNWNAKVTDSRGQSKTKTGSYKVLTYSKPRINGFDVYRCNEDGTINDSGTYIKVLINTSINPCNDGTNDKNTKEFKLSCKLTNSDEWTEVPLESSSYDLVDEIILSEFDVNNSYQFKIEATDFFETTSKIMMVGSSFSLMDFHHSGKGMAIGKASELEGILDIGLSTKLTGGLTPVILEADTDLDDVKTPNFYTGENITDYKYVNCPLGSGTFYLEVVSCGEQGQVRQRISSCSKDTSVTYERFYYEGAWGDWIDLYVGEEVIYNGNSNGEITLKKSTTQYIYIDIYFNDNNGKTGGHTRVYSPNNNVICLNLIESSDNDNTYIRRTNYTISGNTITPDIDNAGYVRFNGNSVSHSTGTNYLYITRVLGHR